MVGEQNIYFKLEKNYLFPSPLLHFSLPSHTLVLGRGRGRVTGHLGAHPAGVLAGIVQGSRHGSGQHRGQREEGLGRGRWGRRQSEEVVTDLKMSSKHLSLIVFLQGNGALSLY